jgi:hypothetical protein
MYYDFGRVHQTLRVTPAMAAEVIIMFGALKKSLASWRDEHGFGILCILSPDGERFVVVPSPPDTPPALQGVPPWRGMSEADLRTHLTQTGLSAPDIEEAVQLSREWATTISGSGLALWPRSGSN